MAFYLACLYHVMDKIYPICIGILWNSKHPWAYLLEIMYLRLENFVCTLYITLEFTFCIGKRFSSDPVDTILYIPLTSWFLALGAKANEFPFNKKKILVTIKSKLVHQASSIETTFNLLTNWFTLPTSGKVYCSLSPNLSRCRA